MHRYLWIAFSLGVIGLAACSKPSETSSQPNPVATSTHLAATPTATPPQAAAAASEPGMTMAPNGLQYQDVEVGDGPRPLFNQTVRVRYTAKLTNGTVFDTNIDNGRGILEFRLGRGEVIKGWDLGIGGSAGIPPMRAGGHRKLIIPPALGYGSEPYGTLPANSTLIFDVQLVGVRR